MEVADILGDAFGRLPAIVRRAVDGLGPEQLAAAPRPGANSIGWLIWHLARVQDDHVAEVMGEPQIWTTGDWAPRFGLAPGASDTGYDHDPAEAASVRADSADVLVAYHDAVAARTFAYVATLGPAERIWVVFPAYMRKNDPNCRQELEPGPATSLKTAPVGSAALASRP